MRLSSKTLADGTEDRIKFNVVGIVGLQLDSDASE